MGFPRKLLYIFDFTFRYIIKVQDRIKVKSSFKVSSQALKASYIYQEELLIAETPFGFLLNSESCPVLSFL